MSTDDASPDSFRPLYDQAIAALDTPPRAELPALQKLFPRDSVTELANVVNLCGSIDPRTRKLDILKSLDPYHIMSGHLTGRQRHSSTRIRCGLALMWASAPGPSGGRYWELQAWSLDTTTSPTPTE